MTKIDGVTTQGLFSMDNTHSYSPGQDTAKPSISLSGENTKKDDLWIGWITPFHLFYPDSGKSLCGQSGEREKMSHKETSLFTTQLSSLLGHIRSQDQIVRLGKSICRNCFKSLCSESNKAKSTLLKEYTERILNSNAKEPIGFCHSCETPVDPDSCNTAMFKSRQPVYVCDLCCMESLEGLMGNVGDNSDPTIKAIRDRLDKRISEKREGRLE